MRTQSVYSRGTNIIDEIEQQRLQWAGHARRSQNEVIKAVMEQNACGKTENEMEKIDFKNDAESLGGWIGKKPWTEKKGGLGAKRDVPDRFFEPKQEEADSTDFVL